MSAVETPGSQILPLRSVLFAPGNEPRKVSKVAGFGADAIILDLEDAVPDAEKVAVRPIVRAAVAEMSAPIVCVRVNGFDSGLTEGDIEAIVGPGLDAIMIPKVAGADEVLEADRLIALAERQQGLAVGTIRILALIETCTGVLHASSAAAASSRILTLAFGSGDLARDLDLPAIRQSADGAELQFARSKLVYDARAAGLARPVDGPHLAVRDLEGFEVDCHVARRLGYQGKTCLHPAQVPIANRVFAPEPEEVALAHRVIEEFKAAEAQGSAAIMVDGVFVDYPIVKKAEGIVALANALAARDSSLTGTV